MSMQTSRLGRVRIAPSVLAMIVSLTACEVPGVVRMGALSPLNPRTRWNRRQGRQGVHDGVRLLVRDGAVWVDVSVIARPDSNLHALGALVKARVGAALARMVGMPVEEVNVFIDDVAE